MKKSIKILMVLPVLLLLIGFAVILYILLYICPDLVNLYQSTNIKLPLITKYIICLSDYVRLYWWVILPVISAIVLFNVIFLVLLFTVKKFRPLSDKLVLIIPITGKIFKLYNLHIFMTYLNLQLLLGLQFNKSTQISIRRVKNSYIKKDLENMYQSINAGLDPITAFKTNKNLPERVRKCFNDIKTRQNLQEAIEKSLKLLEINILQLAIFQITIYLLLLFVFITGLFYFLYLPT
ncbi:MAG: hypothetical protein AB1782_06595 [Cyanobacteriota bacterium]